MANSFETHYYPVFEPGFFEKHPELLGPFIQDAPDYLRKQYQERREIIRRYEGRVTWPVVVGRGFCGATHPGAGNVFATVLSGGDNRIYNSDCLYVNPAHNVFAIADAPGASIFSRDIFEKLDLCLKTRPVDDLETIIDELNAGAGGGECAALSLVHFPRNGDLALAFVAGDTYLFQGNVVHKRISRIEGPARFFGSSHDALEPAHVGMAEGDFFIIASDGISSIRTNDEETLEELLLSHAINDIEGFAANVTKRCNRVSRQKIGQREVSTFVSGDNISVLLVYPAAGVPGSDSVILGGYAEVVEAEQR